MIAPDLREMRALLPILNEVDESSLLRLDSTEWFQPSAAQARRLKVAADRLGVYLMPYRAGSRAAFGQGLCNLIAAAELDAAGVAEIASLETARPASAIVAYERPIRHRK
jgi:hypothetical protein